EWLMKGIAKYGDTVTDLLHGAAKNADVAAEWGLLVSAVRKAEDSGGILKSADELIEGTGNSLSSKIYTPVEYKGTVKVNGDVKDVSRRVYQRNDIDINYFDETTGLTNLERMQAGKPPIGTDGNPIELHHVLQQEAGPMAELREITHQQYYSQLHGLVENGASFRNNPLLNKQYNNFRYNYWKWRASLITGGK
ncbi:HNH/ENDO VII family nuclease, partial [Papillibacter cinnamivorans]